MAREAAQSTARSMAPDCTSGSPSSCAAIFGAGADQHHRLCLLSKLFSQYSVVAIFVLAAENDPQVAGERVDCLFSRVHIGGFRIVVIPDTLGSRTNSRRCSTPGKVRSAPAIASSAAPASRAASVAAIAFSTLCTPRIGRSSALRSASCSTKIVAPSNQTSERVWRLNQCGVAGVRAANATHIGSSAFSTACPAAAFRRDGPWRSRSSRTCGAGRDDLA